MSTVCLTTTDIHELFTEEIEARSGQITDTFEDGSRIFLRSILPPLAKVQPRDPVQGGVALKSTPEETCVIPYVFRQVCRNGSVMARSLQAKRLVFSNSDSPNEVELAIREAVGACCEREVFENSVQAIRSSVNAGVDSALTLIASLGKRKGMHSKFISEILSRFLGERRRDRFTLMNAVTSLARDTADPEDRWRLEELGGGIAAGILPQSPADAPGMVIEREEEETASCKA